MKKIFFLLILSFFIVGQGSSIEKSELSPGMALHVARHMISEMDRTSQLFPFPKAVSINAFLEKALQIEPNEFLRAQPWVDLLGLLTPKPRNFRNSIK